MPCGVLETSLRRLEENDSFYKKKYKFAKFDQKRLLWQYATFQTNKPINFVENVGYAGSLLSIGQDVFALIYPFLESYKT